MTIWTFIVGCALLCPIFTAIDKAKELHSGVSGYALALLTGAAVGVFFAWALNEWMNRSVLTLQRYRGKDRNYVILGSVNFVGGLLWTFLAVLASGRLSAIILRVL